MLNGSALALLPVQTYDIRVALFFSTDLPALSPWHLASSLLFSLSWAWLTILMALPVACFVLLCVFAFLHIVCTNIFRIFSCACWTIQNTYQWSNYSSSNMLASQNTRLDWQKKLSLAFCVCQTFRQGPLSFGTTSVVRVAGTAITTGKKEIHHLRDWQASPSKRRVSRHRSCTVVNKPGFLCWKVCEK